MNNPGRLLLACLLLAVVAPARARDEAVEEPSPAKIKAFLQSCETARRGAILQLEHTLRGLRSQNPPAASPAARRMAEIEADLRVLRAAKEPVVPTLVFPPEAGSIGRLPKLTCHVDQILNDKEMLVRCFFTLKVPAVRHFQTYAETVVRPVTFLIRGRNTSDFHEGTDIQLVEVFEIRRQAAYRTEDGGDQTAWTLSPFDMKWVAPYFRSPASGKTSGQ